MLVFKESSSSPVDCQSKLENNAVFQLKSYVYNLYTRILTVKIRKG